MDREAEATPAPEHDLVTLLLVVQLLLCPADARPEWMAVGLLLAALSLLLGGGGRVPGLPWLAGWVGLSLLSLLDSPTPGPGIEALWRIGLSVGAFLAAQRSSRRLLAPAAALAAIVHGGLALWQRAISLPRAAAELGSAPTPGSELLLQRLEGGRAFSTFVLPGQLGAVLAALLPVLAIAWLGGRGWRRGLYALAVAGALVGLALSAALGAVLALLVVATAWLLLHLPRVGRRPLAAAAILLVVAATSVVLLRLDDVRDWQHRDHPLAPRLLMWQRGLAVLADRPLTGFGLGSYPQVWLAWARPGDVPARNAHMSWLELGAESGLPALLMLGGFLAAVLRRRRDDAAGAAALVMLVHASGDFDLQSAGLAPLLFLLLGFATQAPDHTPGSEPGQRLRWRWPAAAALGLLAALAVLRERARVEPVLETRGGLVAQLERSLRLWPLDARARGELARARLEEGDLARALDEALRARSLEPRAAWLAALEGEIRVRRGEAFAAWFAFRDAQQLFPAREEYGQVALTIERRLESSRRSVPGVAP